MYRLRRRLLGAIVAVAALTGLAKLALASDYAARETVARIGAAVGAPVKAGDVRLGFTASGLSGVRVFEFAATTDAPAWTAVGTVEADLSLWQLLTNDLGRG
ncbi:MAG TPA: hypothetical protein VGF55_12215, partial [Gemmataceae bacterium]